MNRKRALICHEMRTMRWFLLAGCLCALAASGALYVFLERAYANFETMPRSSSLSPLYIYDGGALYGSTISVGVSELLRTGTVAGIFALVFMSAVQFSDTHKKKSGEYLASLPFTHGQCFVVKAILGYGAITVSCLVLAAGIIWVREQFMDTFIKCNITRPEFALICGNETLLHTVRSLVLFWLVLMAMYSIYMAVQSLVGQGIVASLIGVGATAAPLQLGMLAMYLYTFRLQQLKDMDMLAEFGRRSPHITNILGAFWGQAMGTVTEIPEVVPDSEDAVMENWGQLVYYENMWLLFGGMLAILIACTALAYYVNRKKDLACAGILVPMKGARIAIGIGCGICFGTTITYLLGLDIGVAGNVIVCLVLMTGIFLVCQKLLKRIVK